MSDGFGAHSLKVLPKWTLLGILLGFLLLTGFHVWVDARYGHRLLNADVYYHMVYAAGFFEPETFRLDPVFGGLGGEGLSVYPWYLLTIWLLSKSVPFHQVFLMIQPVLGMAYLLAAFYFLYKMTGRPWISALLAYLSGRYTPIFPTEQWGALSVSQVAPAATPVAVKITLVAAGAGTSESPDGAVSGGAGRTAPRRSAWRVLTPAAVPSVQRNVTRPLASVERIESSTAPAAGTAMTSRSGTGLPEASVTRTAMSRRVLPTRPRWPFPACSLSAAGQPGMAVAVNGWTGNVRGLPT